jgi:hypothetical protein
MNDTTAAAELAAALAPDADHRAAAVELLRSLAPQGHALSFLAGALRRACIPTPSGRGGWHAKSVQRLADEAGITVGYKRAG